MGETIILSVAQSILKKISTFTGDLVLSSITDVIKAAKSAKHDLKIIADKMNAICAVLEDAENKQFASKSIDVWLRDLKDIVYDIDDLLNEVAYDVLQRKANEGHFGRQLRYYLSSSSPLVSRFVLSHKIKDLRIKLENIVAKKNDFELTKCAVKITRDQIRDPFDVCDFVYESDILGREDAKQFIKSKLLTATRSNTNVLSVLPIVGMGGIGKTALAKYVYRDVDVVQHFDLMLWACVSDEFDISKIIGDILSNATTSKGKGKRNTSEENASNQHLGILVNKLCDLLAGKKYLLVLDDVWVENHQDWKNSINILDNQIGGSVILITTRDHKVASLIETIDQYNLNRLADSVCWSIFKQLAFKDGEEKMYPNLVQVGMSIVEKCGGIPLVVRCLGSMLKIERDEHEWRRIANLESFATIHGQYDKVLQLLNLSYIKLPRHLKRCFAYLSLFNKDANLVAGEVSILWSALGVFPLEDEKLHVLDRGYNYFMELISRSFVQDTECYSGVLTGKVHDLLHDLAVNILNEDLCVITLDKLEISEFVRHIVWGYETPNTLSNKEFPKKLMKAKKLRTFQFNYNMERISQSFLKGIISNFKYIRVLDLSKSLFTKLPRSIGDLVHLRYLDLSYNVIIKS